METGKTTTNGRIAVLVIIGVIILLGLLYVLSPKQAAAPVTDNATTTPSTSTAQTSKSVIGKAPAEITATPPIPMSELVSVSKANGTVSIYSGIDPAGRKVYSPVVGADAATFKALSTPIAVEYPTAKSGFTVTSLGTGSAAYYKDKNRIYVLSIFETTAATHVGMEVVQGADVATFAVTKSPWYATDKTNVYRLTAPTSVGPYGPGSYAWKPYDLIAIPNADPATFVLKTGDNSDAYDARYIYRKGVQIGTR